mgnify:CR=1 FL=1
MEQDNFEPTVVELTEVTTAVIREVVDMAALPQFFDRAFSAITPVLAQQGVSIVGAAFARYHGVPTTKADLEVGFPVAKLPVKLHADLAINSEAESPNRLPVTPGQVAPTLFADENNFGWMVGFQVGKASKPGQWQVSYDYRDLQPDAVLGALTDADFGGGGTDAKGHKVSLAYCLSKNVTLGATFFCDKQDIHTHATGNDFYHRLQLDLMVKF